MPFTSPGTGIMPAVGGGGNWMSNLFQNKLFLQYLAAEGQDLMQNTPGKNLNAVTQQSIASENYVKLLKRMLAGEAIPGASMTVDEKGRTFKLAHESLKPVSQVTPPMSATTPTAGGVDQNRLMQMLSGGNFSPFPTSQQVEAPVPAGSNVEGVVPTQATQAPAVQDPTMQLMTQLLAGGNTDYGAAFGNMSKSDLAGLTPEMVSSALQFKMQQEQIGKKNIFDVMDLMMRGKELGVRAPYMKALTDEAIDRVASNQPIVQINGLPYSMAEYLKWQQIQKENLSTNQKDYSTYAAQETAAGRTPKSFEEFLNNNFTTDIKNYRLYTEQEKAAGRTPKNFDPWLTEHEGSRATRISIGEKAQGAAATARATSTVDAQSQVSDPAKRNTAIQKGFSNLGMDDQLTLQTGTPAEISSVKNISAAQTIEEQIIAAGGRIVGRDKNAKQMTWKVVWPPAAEGEKERSETIIQPRY